MNIDEMDFSTMTTLRRFREQPRRISILLLTLLVCGSHPQCASAESSDKLTLPAGIVDSSPLLEIEQRALPPVLHPGPRRFDDLPAYYMAENAELRLRFEAARRAFEADTEPRPFRCVTLIAGAAGVGKTFIKSEAFSKNYPKDIVCKFDIRELYQQWQEAGHTEPRADLQAGSVVLSNMLAQKDLSRRRLTEYLQQQPACFFVIDSLDEIHPDDYVAVLQEIERFALDGDRDFVHVVVLGRGLALRDYWQQRATVRTPEQLDLFLFQPPRFQTFGDLLVSTWNYHTWACKLAWSPSGQREAMALEDYLRWIRADYPLNGPYRTVSFVPNQCMDARVQGTLEQWACRYPVVDSMLYNLAGNTMIREICQRFVGSSRDYDERAVMEAYFSAWLERDTGSDNRPSAAKPEHLDLYLQLLEGVAVKYLAENRIDERGFFEVRDTDTVAVEYLGELTDVPVYRILNRSGLKFIDPREPGTRRYRFEPVWFHRLLVEKHNDRVRSSLVAGVPAERGGAD